MTTAIFRSDFVYLPRSQYKITNVKEVPSITAKARTYLMTFLTWLIFAEPKIEVEIDFMALFLNFTLEIDLYIIQIKYYVSPDYRLSVIQGGAHAI